MQSVRGTKGNVSRAHVPYHTLRETCCAELIIREDCASCSPQELCMCKYDHLKNNNTAPVSCKECPTSLCNIYISSIYMLYPQHFRTVFSPTHAYGHQNNLMAPHQSEFKEGHSTETALLAIEDQLHTASEQRPSPHSLRRTFQ